MAIPASIVPRTKIISENNGKHDHNWKLNSRSKITSSLKEFNKAILFSSLGSFWWGAIGVIYFSYFSFIGHIELVIHRCIWTAVMLIVTTQFFS